MNDSTIQNDYLPAVKQIRQDMKTREGAKLELLQQIKEEVVVIRGEFDKVEVLLEMLEIPHQVLDGWEIGKYWFRPDQVVLVNCPGKIRRPDRLAACVGQGGWLVTSDWALSSVVESAFPGTIRRDGRTPDDVVTCQSCQGALTRGMPDTFDFWLERGSFPVECVGRVSTLVKSDEMQQKYGSPDIVVGFGWGKGKVIHMVSHFALQKSKSGATTVRDGLASLQLLTNILAHRVQRNQV